MRLLLDTHTFIWYINGDSQLSQRARDCIEELENTRYLSTASLWEIAIKYSIRKLELEEPYEILIPEAIRLNKMRVLSISFAHISQLANLDFPNPKYKDPFDRLIIAQAMVEKLPIISIDAKFDVYSVQRFW